jgi:hypothetical protein
MAEAKPAQDGDGTEAPKKRRFAFMSISLSAFIMSATATLISAFYGLQGAEIVVQPAKQVLLYRDGEGPNSVLAIAMRTDLINASSGYGDILLDAQLKPGRSGPTFGYEGMVTPVFTAASEEAAKGCELGASCLALPGMLMVHKNDQVTDLPSGSARALMPYFWLSKSSCSGGSACDRFANFDEAVKVLAAGPAEIRMILRFHGDGEREILCRGGKIDAAYLSEVGWTQIPCTMSKVSGAPLL